MRPARKVVRHTPDESLSDLFARHPTAYIRAAVPSGYEGLAAEMGLAEVTHIEIRRLYEVEQITKQQNETSSSS